MRYKCVIPMVIDQEAKEREKRQKEEEKEEKEEKEKEKGEEDPIATRNDKCINETEINESKNRVYEHFKQISQTNKQVKTKKKKKSKQLVLNQIHGRKRKREFNIRDEIQKKDAHANDNDFSMTVPYLGTGTVHVSKKVKQDPQGAIEKQNIQESFAQAQSNINSETVQSIR